MFINIIEAGRKVWPADVKDAGRTVTLRIDTLKERTVVEVQESMRNGEVWVLVQHSGAEAFVERHLQCNLQEAMGSRRWQMLELLTKDQLDETNPANPV